ncbi:ribonuclease P protein component [Candidatus Azambacteria bacterium RIFCSPHIGHO2_01_FULL_40_24]|uniref:Ribonuclease P protein component n=1 Tax=Candidatus Azambacteria bacterium RIFCSPHIGHO2_01_FULL_40_24 TaxID=1797301 RepID=A0A1F5B4N7_9BACT|nr:MAG: ribonuclease P protein component [Candidatus Azambacteria bacterium RIFCSPHIGHO2_01_FULL_40_24]
MLPGINRLKSDEDFKNVFKNGKKSENQFFRIKFLKNQKNLSRFGFIISTKLLKKATVRNILKRRLRMICRHLLKDLKCKFDVVIWPKTNSISLNYKDLTNYLRELILAKEN